MHSPETSHGHDSDAPERGVIARAQAGEHAAFGLLVRWYATRVRHVLLRRGADHTLADDLTQETFLLAWRGIARYRPREESSFVSWLFVIAVRVHATHARRAVRHAANFGAAHARAAESAALPIAPSESDLWDLADALLTPHARTALWLCYAEGLSPTQIARVLECTPVHVRVTLLRARARLRAALSEANASRTQTPPCARPFSRSNAHAHAAL